MDGFDLSLRCATSTQLMMNAAKNGDPWETVVPMAMTVVIKSISRDFFEEIGGPKGRYVAEYLYRNPYYDAHEAEFRGFGYAESWDRERDADGNGQVDSTNLCSAAAIQNGEAPMVGRNWFHTGTRPECMVRPANNPNWNDNWGPHSVACAQKLHDDNPLAGLNGASIKSDVYSPCTNKIVEATVSELEVRKLYESNNPHDNRNVYFVTPNQGRIYKYNPDALQGGGELDSYLSVKMVDTTSLGVVYPSITGDYVPAAAVGDYHLIWGSTQIDNHGNPTQAYYGGFKRLSSDTAYEFADCDQYTEHFTSDFDPGTWMHYGISSYVVGAVSESGNTVCDDTCSAAHPCRNVSKAYMDDGSGDMKYSQFTYRDADGTSDSLIANYKQYNQFGQVTHNYAGCTDPNSLPGSCMRHSQNVYQSQDAQSGGAGGFSAYITKEISYKGGVPLFVTQASWDAGLAQITQTVDIHGNVSAVDYDALGRFVASFGPVLHGESAGQLCNEPLKTVEYVYGYHEAGVPMSTIITHINTAQIRCKDNPWDRRPSDMTDISQVHSSRMETSKTFIDALGRTYATVVSGDDHLGGASAFPFVVNGEGYTNAKGAVYKSCEGNVLQTMPITPMEVIGKRGTTNCSVQQFDAYGRPTVATGPDGTQAKVVYGLDSADSYDHLDIHGNACQKDTYSTQRVDGLGRTRLSISRYRKGSNCAGAMTEKWSVPTFDAMGNVIVATQYERVAGGDGTQLNKIARRATYDTLGRLRFNSAVTFGTWEYNYDALGQMNYAKSPLNDEFFYDYDEIGRLITKGSRHRNAPANQLDLDAVYFYDAYPGINGNAGVAYQYLLEPIEASGQFVFPTEDVVTLGKLVASWDKSGISVSAGDRGLFGESWRMVFPDTSKVYYSKGLSDYAGQLVYAENDKGIRTTASYYDDGTAQSSYVSYPLAGGGRTRETIVEKSYTNILGQVERVEYGDAGNTVSWSGYDSVSHRTLANVVQQNKAGVDSTLMAFGYAYNKVGMLTGISDFRGRDSSGNRPFGADLPTLHPSTVGHSAVGYHFAAFPGDLDPWMTAPKDFNGTNYSEVTPTGWPIAASPSDAVFTYDSRNQLVGEDRDFITPSNDDYMDATDLNSKRARSLHWDFDSRGSMISWTEEGDGDDSAAVKNLGRALGGTILNGWQLNEQLGNPQCMYALESSSTLPSNCYIPDAVYFATNVNDPDVPDDRGTCIWANYDAMGRMTSQTVRTGCSDCSFAAGRDAASCTDRDPAGDLPALLSKRIDYTYIWNVHSHLVSAEKQCIGTVCEAPAHVLMTYQYDASGNRVIREQSDLPGSSIADIYQDVYLGGTERRHVQLRNQWNEAVSIHSTEQDLTFVNIEHTKELHYAAGVRIQWDGGSTGGGLSDDPQIFLSFNNHLGSTSAVIDFKTGDLVEWNTNYAYGADESRWKNDDPKYDNAEEPYGFTGKEEDKAVGLHYFGARYYSSYLGRWLSPDPPVIHGGGLSNHYNYGGNSPYIYVDPDGNWIQAAVGALVGFVAGYVSTRLAGGSRQDAIKAAVVGAAVGALTGGAGAIATAAGASTMGAAAVAAGTSAAFSMVQTGIQGGSAKDIIFNGAMSFGSGMIGAGMGRLSSGLKQFGQAAMSYTTGLAMSYGAAALSGGVNGENWDDILVSYSVGFAVGMVGNRIESELTKSSGMGSGRNRGMMAAPDERAEYGPDEPRAALDDIGPDPRDNTPPPEKKEKNKKRPPKKRPPRIKNTPATESFDKLNPDPFKFSDDEINDLLDERGKLQKQVDDLNDAIVGHKAEKASHESKYNLAVEHVKTDDYATANRGDPYGSQIELAWDVSQLASFHPRSAESGGRLL